MVVGVNGVMDAIDNWGAWPHAAPPIDEIGAAVWGCNVVEEKKLFCAITGGENPCVIGEKLLFVPDGGKLCIGGDAGTTGSREML